jgi:hypothetical protein
MKFTVSAQDSFELHADRITVYCDFHKVGRNWMAPAGVVIDPAAKTVEIPGDNLVDASLASHTTVLESQWPGGQKESRLHVSGLGLSFWPVTPAEATFKVTIEYCTGHVKETSFLSYKAALDYALAHQDTAHVGSNRYNATREFGPGQRKNGVRAIVDVTVCGCVESTAVVSETGPALRCRAWGIAEALKDAFGGASQVAPQDIGRAVAGQINNNGLAGGVEEVCAAVVAAFDGDSEHETSLVETVDACKMSLAGLAARSKRPGR